MEARELAKFDQSDLTNHKMLGLVLSKASLELKGDAVIKVAFLLKWYADLEVKISDAVKKQVLDSIETPVVKPLEGTHVNKRSNKRK